MSNNTELFEKIRRYSELAPFEAPRSNEYPFPPGDSVHNDMVERGIISPIVVDTSYPDVIAATSQQQDV